MEYLSKEALHQQFRADLDRFENLRINEASTFLFDKERSVCKHIDELMVAQAFCTYDENEGKVMNRLLPPQPLEKVDTFILQVCEEDRIALGDPQSHLKLINSLDRRLRSKDPHIPSAARAIYALAEIAGRHKPVDVDPAIIHRKQPHETIDGKIFRNAIAVLQQSKLHMDKHDLAINIWITENPSQTDIILSDPEKAPVFCRTQNKMQLRNIRQGVAAKLLKPNVKARDVRDEFYLWRIHAQAMEDKQHVADNVPVRETAWTILPSAVKTHTDVRLLAETVSRTFNNEASEAAKVDPTRIQAIGELALNWGTGAELVVSKLETGSSKRRYIGVILPEVLPDGRVQQHFVADNPYEGNGRYIWRAEKGVDPETGEVTHTWEDVFDKRRDDAKDLGARRLNHTPTIAERTLEYLTRDPSELDK